MLEVPGRSCLTELAFGSSAFQTRKPPQLSLQAEASMTPSRQFHNGRFPPNVILGGGMDARNVSAGVNGGQGGLAHTGRDLQFSAQNAHRPKKRGPNPGKEKGCQNCRFVMWVKSTGQHPKDIRGPKLARHTCHSKPGYYNDLRRHQKGLMSWEAVVSKYPDADLLHSELSQTFELRMQDNRPMKFLEASEVSNKVQATIVLNRVSRI